MTHKRAIIISAEFASFVGRGRVDPAWLPPEPIVIGFGDMGEPAVSILASENVDHGAGGHILLFAISRAACLRMFGLLPSVAGSWYLSADLRELGRALVAVEGESEVAGMLRVGRSLELLCRLFEALEEHRMVEFHGKTSLSEIDAKRVAAAHQARAIDRGGGRAAVGARQGEADAGFSRDVSMHRCRGGERATAVARAHPAFAE